MSEGPALDWASILPIVVTLEAQQLQLDRLGAHIPAAHLDAAIAKLRFDYMLENEGEPDAQS